MEVAARLILVTIGTLLLASAWTKLRRREAFKQAVASWGVSPKPLLPVLVAALPAVEAAVGGAAIVAGIGGAFVRPSALAFVLLLASFTLAQVLIRLHTSRAKCGCGIWHSPVGTTSIVRAALLALLASLPLFA